jgi:UDPglucose 6-dehydrogenase
MKLCFLGDTHAAQHLAAAAREKGFRTGPDPKSATLIFVSMDTPTDESGRRDLDPIRKLVAVARRVKVPVVLTSAVPPGFTRSLGFNLWHQAETLRIKDAADRARKPEVLIVGCQNPADALPDPYQKYLDAFRCPVLKMSWEEAEFAKMAINCFLAAQVEVTNELAGKAAKVGAKWDRIAEVLRHDARIGPQAYLDPGDWKQSTHLLRDMRTLAEI